MAKDYDKIIKENIEAIFLPLSAKYLGIRIVKSEELSDKLQSTIEREPDFIRLIETDKAERLILHLEFQVQDDPEMIYRMSEYGAILLRKYRLPLRQFVIYLGTSEPKMTTTLPPGQQVGHFELKNIRAFEADKLLQSDIPEEIILAILGNYQNIPPEEIIRSIVQRLKTVSTRPLALEKYIRQLGILSRLRKLEEITIKTVRNMPITYDKESDFLYQEGKAEGKVEGKAEGEAAGRSKEKHLLIVNMLKQGTLSLKQIAEITQKPIEYIQKIQEGLK